MCGIIGLTSQNQDAAFEVYKGLYQLQHRGQDGAGIVSYDSQKNKFYQHKNSGLISHVFSEQSLTKLVGEMALGHTRYSTIGTQNQDEVQPFIINYPFGISIVHNGNIVNMDEAKVNMWKKYGRSLLTQSDSELLLNYISIGIGQIEAQNQSRNQNETQNKNDYQNTNNIFERLTHAVQLINSELKGSYAVIGVIAGVGLFAFTDPDGIRPLVMGKKENQYIFASETAALTALGYEYIQDVTAGELILIEQNNFKNSEQNESTFENLKISKSSVKNSINTNVNTNQNQHQNQHQVCRTNRSLSNPLKAKPCMFEWVYFASTLSSWHQKPIYDVRLKLGEELAQVCQSEILSGSIKPDIIAPVPDTSRTSAVRLSEKLNIPYREVLIKNRYIQRSFILNKNSRKAAIENKLFPVVSEIKDKNILLVDDSIVRGNTSQKIIELLKRHGAKNVYLAVTCPPIRYPCYFGIDFPSESELIASNKSILDIEKRLGADKIIYLPYLALKRAIGLESMCMACVDGRYPIEVKVEQFLEVRKQNISERREYI